MKTKLFSLLIALVFLFGCSNEDSITPDVRACFDYSPSDELKIGDEITFTNCSENATTYAWDFGDGDISTEKNPTHVYESGGEYTVKMIAANESSADTISDKLTIESSADSYLKHYGKTYSLTKAFVASFTRESERGFILQIGGDKMKFEGGDLTGDGEGVTVFANGIFSEGAYTILADSWALSSWTSNPSGPGTGESSSLEGGIIKVISASNPIEVEITGTDTDVYYYGNSDFADW